MKFLSYTFALTIVAVNNYMRMQMDVTSKIVKSACNYLLVEYKGLCHGLTGVTIYPLSGILFSEEKAQHNLLHQCM